MARTRNNSLKAVHRKRIAELYLKRGLNQTEIAAILSEEFKESVTQSTVSRDLKWLRSEWQRQARRDVAEAQGEKLAELQAIKLEAWQAWEGSKQDSTSETERTLEASGGKHGPYSEHETTKTRLSSVGEKGFLELVRKTVNDEIKLLGLDQSGGISLSADTLLMLQILGVDTKQVVAEFEAMIAEAAKEHAKTSEER